MTLDNFPALLTPIEDSSISLLYTHLFILFQALDVDSQQFF